jgi:hypothetical protein
MKVAEKTSLRAFFLTSLVAQHNAALGDGRSGQPFTGAQWRSALPRRSPAWPSVGVRGTPMIKGWCLPPARIQVQDACGSWIVLA